MTEIFFEGHLDELAQKLDRQEISHHLPLSHEIPCKFITSYWVVAGIKNCIILVHGPEGCAFAAKELRHHNTNFCGCRYDFTASTGLNETTIIFGGETRLANAIQEIDQKHQPDLIALLTTCSSGIIGDNVDGIINNLKDRIRSKIFLIKCEGFSGDFRCGYDEAYIALSQLMQPGKKRPGYVNILGTRKGPEPLFGQGEYREIIRMVEGLGLKINAIISGGCTLDQIEKAAQVECNIAWCSDLGIRLGEVMQEKFNIPYLKDGMPYGYSETLHYINAIAAMTGREKEAQAFIDAETDRIGPMLEETRKRVKNKTAIVALGPIRSIHLANFLKQDLGMNVILHNLHPFQIKERRAIVRHFLSRGVNPRIVITGGSYTFGAYNAMKQEDADSRGLSHPEKTLFFGSIYQFPGVPMVNIDRQESFPHVGFKGIENICHYIKRALEQFKRPRSEMFRRAIYGD